MKWATAASLLVASQSSAAATATATGGGADVTAPRRQQPKASRGGIVRNSTIQKRALQQKKHNHSSSASLLTNPFELQHNGGNDEATVTSRLAQAQRLQNKPNDPSTNKQLPKKKACDPNHTSSTDSDIGILGTCGPHQVCVPHSDLEEQGGWCEPSPESQAKKQRLEEIMTAAKALANNKEKEEPKECDPLLGVLACSSDETCQPSETSDLGGFCVFDDASSSEGGHRRMQYGYEDYYLYCDYSEYNYRRQSGIINCYGGKFRALRSLMSCLFPSCRYLCHCG